MKTSLLCVLALIALSSPLYSFSSQTQLTVTAVNRLNIRRQNETLELTAKDLAITSAEAWNRYVDEFAGRLGSPIGVTVVN